MSTGREALVSFQRAPDVTCVYRLLPGPAQHRGRITAVQGLPRRHSPESDSNDTARGVTKHSVDKGVCIRSPMKS